MTKQQLMIPGPFCEVHRKMMNPPQQTTQPDYVSPFLNPDTEYLMHINNNTHRELVDVYINNEWFKNVQVAGDLVMVAENVKHLQVSLDSFSSDLGKNGKKLTTPKSITINNPGNSITFSTDNFFLGEKRTPNSNKLNYQLKEINFKSKHLDLDIRDDKKLEKITVCLDKSQNNNDWYGRDIFIIENCKNLKEITLEGFETTYHHSFHLRNIPDDCIINFDKNITFVGSIYNPANTADIKQIITEGYDQYTSDNNLKITSLFPNKTIKDGKFVQVTYGEFKDALLNNLNTNIQTRFNKSLDWEKRTLLDKQSKNKEAGIKKEH